MKILLLILLAVSNIAFADVKVTFDHDAEFYRAHVVQTTLTSETNDLHDFFEALNLDEEYRETEAVKKFTSTDKKFFFICERSSHPQTEMVASCSFRIKKSQDSSVSVMGMQGFEVWTLNKDMSKEVLPALPVNTRPVVINVNRKFSVAVFPDLVAFNFNL